jgi:putative lipoprotein
VLGNEPFWSLKFDNSKQASFAMMGEDKQSLKLKDRKLTQTTRRYEFDDANLQMSNKLCNDTMSDTLYGWTGVITIDGQTRQGCATLSNSDTTLSWTGNYVAQSTETAGFTVSMTLLPDHTAITRYEYPDNSPATEERGFWQQLNNKQVQVIMTRHQQQYLVSQRIFTLDGNKLIAKQEKVGDIVYPIANGGLVLFKGE